MNQLSWNNTYWLCRPIDPEDPVNLKAIRLAFVMQLVTDICRETPKIGGLELLVIAQKVTDGRVGKDVPIKKMGHATMAALQVPATFNSAHAEHGKKRGNLYNRTNMPIAK